MASLVRWLMLILTSWCLNSDIVEAHVEPGTFSPVQASCTESVRAIGSMAQTAGRYSGPLLCPLLSGDEFGLETSWESG